MANFNTTFVDRVGPVVDADWLNSVNARANVFTCVIDPAWGAQSKTGYDNSTAINNAVSWANTRGGGIVLVPVGTFEYATTIAQKKNVVIFGVSKTGSVLKYSGVGAGVKSALPINSSTAANNGIANLTLQCSNAANADGGYVDVGGTFVGVRDVFITGFKFGVIFDQTELADIKSSQLDGNTFAQVWLADGNYTPGASSGYTNRIGIENCQINGSATAYGILDDGGYAHSFTDNNYNGCLKHIRACGVRGLKVDGGEFESAANECIYVGYQDLSGSSHGQCTNVQVKGAFLVPSPGRSSINFASAGSVLLSGNYYGNSTAVPVVGCSNVSSITSFGNYMAGTTAMFDSNATYHTSLDAPFSGFVKFAEIAAASFANNTLAVDSADHRLKYKDNAGTLNKIGYVDSGTFTVTDASGAGLTLTTNYGRWSKVDVGGWKVVTFELSVTYPTTADTNQAKLAGFPFAPANAIYSNRVDGVGSGFWSGATTTVALWLASGSAVTNATTSGKTQILYGSYTTP